MRKFPILSLLLLAGCTTTATAPTLTDSAWHFVTIDGAPPIGDATLSFQGNRLSAHAGCNRMMGPWRSENGTLVAGPLAATKMACEGKMDQERKVADLLGASPTLTLSGNRLTLRTTAHWAELERKR